MKKWVIGIIVAIAAIAMGVGSAFAFNAALPERTENRSSQLRSQNTPQNEQQGQQPGGQNNQNSQQGQSQAPGQRNDQRGNGPFGRFGNDQQQGPFGQQNSQGRGQFGGREGQFGFGEFFGGGTNFPGMQQGQGQFWGMGPGFRFQKNFGQEKQQGQNQQQQQQNQQQQPGGQNSQPNGNNNNSNNNNQNNQGQGNQANSPTTNNGGGQMQGFAMMNANNGNAPFTGLTDTSKRISMDDAVADVEAYLKDQNESTLQVAKVIEFEDTYYVIVTESDSGRGALELLVDPFSGKVTEETGQGRTLNEKYGSRAAKDANAGDNTVTLEDAGSKASALLQAEGVDATLNDGGTSFYGYYTFEYSIDGKTAGLISVNGSNGDVWFHAWHGQFIGEKEYTK